MPSWNKCHILYAVVLVLCFPGVLVARIPEPDTILVGTLAGQNGTKIASRPGQTIVVRAVVDGVTWASAEVPSDGDGKRRN